MMGLENDTDKIIPVLAMREGERQRDEGLARLKYATDYALAGLKGLFLANGAAIVALLTFIGGTNSSKIDKIDSAGIWWSFAAFSVGLASVILVYVLGYISLASGMQSNLLASRSADSAAFKTGKIYDQSKHEKWANCAENAGVAITFVSLAAFLVGAFLALNAIV